MKLSPGYEITWSPISSGVNDKPVTVFSFVFGINNEICGEYLGTGN